MSMLLRERAGPHAAQYRQKRKTERQKSRTDPDLPPPHFWDNLSHIPLVKRALRELDRRNNTGRPQGQEGSETSNPPGDPRRLEAGRKDKSIKRFSRKGGPDLSDLRGYAYNPRKSPPSENRGRYRHRSTMPSRGSAHRGRPSRSGLGKRRRNAASESAESEEYEPRTRGHGRGPQTRARGRNKGPGVHRKSARGAGRDSSTTTTTTTTTTTATSTRTNPHDKAFRQHLLDHNILSVVHRLPSGSKPPPPDNLPEIKAKLGALRTQDSVEDFERFQSEYDRNSNEDDAATLLDKLQGDDATLHHIIRRKTMMSNLAPLTDGTIPHGNPDRAYGAAASELHTNVRASLHDLIVPTPDKDFICPNFVVHVKSEDGSDKVMRGQATYDGALAARGMQALWDFGDGPGDGQAQAARVARTITCTWKSGVLKMYATYHRKPDSDAAGEEALRHGPASHEFPTYISSFLDSWIMTDKEDQFHQGIAAYRNGLDWAKRQRDEVISRANARVQAMTARRHRGGRIAGEQESDSDLTSIHTSQESETREQDDEGQSEGEDNSEGDSAASSSIFARPRSDAGTQNAEDQENEEDRESQEDQGDEDDEDNDIWKSFDSQRTITRSMSRRLQGRMRS